VSSARAVAIGAGLLGTALGAWVVLFVRMRGMDGNPGADLGPLAWFVGVWVTMTAAMMLPSALPMTLVYSRTSADTRRTAAFVAGYVLTWTAYGVVAFAAFRAARALDLAGARPYVAGTALAAAGAYELTRLKALCLRGCRSPFAFLLHRWREGVGGALRMGVDHGAYCVGCCVGLMLALFALGVMSLAWMAVVTLLIAAQKLLPDGDRLTPVYAVLFVALGAWTAVAG
jgi:predicted metal-binding membrane protein